MPTAELPEALGRRIAAFRARLGMTQQDLADRLAMSRNAVSYMETGQSIPGERTILLLAGLFSVEPHELVSGTDYPDAKADRLPLVAARYTDVGARILALDAELRWVRLLVGGARTDAIATIGHELRLLERRTLDPGEQAAVREAVARLRSLSGTDGKAAGST